MGNFSVLVENEKKKARKENLINVRKDIDKKWVLEKINNFIENRDSDYTVQQIIDQIMKNDLVAEMFAKDPSKQNISEKLCSLYLNWKLLPQSGKQAVRFNTDGNIVATKTLGGGKCADFFIKNRYITQKYTGKNTGGAQDNQMDDVITFLINASKKHKCGACVDGWYWEEAGNKEKLKRMFADNPNVIIFSADEIKNGVISLE